MLNENFEVIATYSFIFSLKLTHEIWQYSIPPSYKAILLFRSDFRYTDIVKCSKIVFLKRGHPSSQAIFQMHRHNKMLLNCPPPKRSYPSYKATILLQKGWPCMRGTSILCWLLVMITCCTIHLWLLLVTNEKLQSFYEKNCSHLWNTLEFLNLYVNKKK